MKPLFSFPALVFSLLIVSVHVVQSRPQADQSPSPAGPGLLQDGQALSREFDRMPDDTIQPIPFTETWDSASFTANGWRFPWMQGNWTILDSTGNPAPCAAFTGAPSQSNYIYSLVSPWFDATDLTCDRIYLDFDVSLTTLQTTGTERLTVLIEYDGMDTISMIFYNNSSFSWTHHQFYLCYLSGKYFRIKFVASGTYASRISQWALDNIEISRRCMPPAEPGGFTSGGCWGPDEGTGVGPGGCYIFLSWNPPDCSASLGELYIIYDDNSWEDGLRVPKWETMWLGNLIPLDPFIKGGMESIEVYFVDNGTGSPQPLFIELFDINGNSMAPPVPFFAGAPDSWITIPLTGIPFYGPFYAMVKYDSLPSYGYYLACDTGGPFTSQYLAYQYDGKSWTNPTYWPGGAVFFVRGTALVCSDEGEKKRLVITSAGITEYLSVEENRLDRLGNHESSEAKRSNHKEIRNDPDSTILMGYNVYRKDPFSTTFYKINTTLLTGTSYQDNIECAAHYSITAVYNDDCESEVSENPFELSCWTSIPEESAGNHLQISPNPADDWIEVNSKARIEGVLLYDLTGRELYRKQTPGAFNLRIDLPWLPEGLYIVKVFTEKGPTASRIMILH